MSYKIKDKKTNKYSDPYDSMEEAKEYAITHVENYEKGFYIIDIDCADKVVYEDDRAEVSRIDLIDLD